MSYKLNTQDQHSRRYKAEYHYPFITSLLLSDYLRVVTSNLEYFTCKFSAYMDTIERLMKLLSKHFADDSEPAFN